ncbi:aldehyde dehydrogenase (NADP(+)) [Dyadobacter sp. NIV53]|uniref:aldehyde dehydrogenase (NADP(+)) n=1 Tax=Dyadobacter sp. NIV53 TaxID=2861765 RepID=UPI001C8736CB|nr:aldehyde dehydrogenase (NADP(+)) [Dyadobacter sp. NIV53]
MTDITGANYIGFSKSKLSDRNFQSFSPKDNKDIPGWFYWATEDELDKAVLLADRSFRAFQKVSYQQRALFLETIAEEIMALSDQLLEVCVSESGLPVARITGERARTCNQLRLFARLLRDGWWLDARIDTGIPERLPAPKPDIRRMFVPIGPVAVFGASNFPLAFSTAGGDTASALAAGCPVILKIHPAHPGTSELVATAILKAAKRTGMPDGVFSALHLDNEKVIRLVSHPAVRAVGFTGSRKVGLLLCNAAAARKEPIPVYAEMSSVNPVILLESALQENYAKIARELAAAFTLGAGQFCTNPGLILVTESTATDLFLEEFAKQIAKIPPANMLTCGIQQVYDEKIKGLSENPAVVLLAKTETEAKGNEGKPVAYSVDANDFLKDKSLSAEIFGPQTLIVKCADTNDLFEVLESLEGQLTASLHAAEQDVEIIEKLITITTQKAGRIIFGGYPTGVEVCDAMQHGGPFPSTSDSRSTSVGSAAIYRFARPVAYQDFPDQFLPEALQNKNPLALLRLVNGSWTNEQL